MASAQCGITGGFMWLYDDFVGNGLAAQYAAAINNAITERVVLPCPARATCFLNQVMPGTANATITITSFGGSPWYASTLFVAGLPKGVKASIPGRQAGRRKIQPFLDSCGDPDWFHAPVTVGLEPPATSLETFPFTLAVSVVAAGTAVMAAR